MLVCAAAPAAWARSHKQLILPGTPVPQGFVGVDLNGPPVTTDDHINLSRQLGLMVTSGVQSVRVAFQWYLAQPYPSWNAVPADQLNQFVDVGGVPTDFSDSDEIVGLAAQHGLTVLPTLLYAPGWDAGSNQDGYAPPARSGPFTAYLTALIERYGPQGTFWSNHKPKLPIRMWQIWNEPNLGYYWPQPFAKSYVPLLRAAHTAMKQADPGAKLVLGALTNTAWTYLGQIDKAPGGRGAYDVISVNGFTSTPANVIRFLQYTRRAANRDGDSKKPLLATEVSWPSAKGKSPQHYTWNTTEKGQASNIAELLPLIAAHRAPLGLMGFYYYTWMGQETPHAPAFNYAACSASPPPARSSPSRR